MNIREEKLGDYEIVYALVEEAFKTAEHSDGNEHNLVKRLRNSDGFIKELSLVAEEGGVLLGHIMFTKAKVGEVGALALAPLSVSPDAQRKGVGKALINKGHEIAKAMGYDIVIVLGSEKYYPKMGYIPASVLGIKAPFDVPDENFMAISLSGSTEAINGSVEYVKEILQG